MSTIAFNFKKYESSTEDYAIKVYKDDVLIQGELGVNEVQPDSNPLSVAITSINDDSAGSGPHTYKFEICHSGGEDENLNPDGELDNIIVDDVSHDETNNFLSHAVTIYNPLTADAAANIADGTITSSGTVTTDLNIGGGSQQYYTANPWEDGGLVKLGSVVVLAYAGNFNEWYDGLGIGE
jgi:hypothetical protein